VHGPSGSITGASVIARDITQTKQMAAALRESEARFRHLFENSRAVMNTVAEGLYTVDVQGLVTYLNPTAEALFGWTSAELMGRKMHDATHYRHPDGTPFPAGECAGLQVLQSGVVLQEYEDVFIRKDGSFFPVVYSAAPLTESGQTVGIVVSFRDDTERRRAEEALKEAAQRKDEFLAMLAHELRNPLAPVRNALHLLQLQAGDVAAVDRWRGMMERQVAHMTRLVDDLLDVSRISRGRVSLQRERLDLRRLVQLDVADHRVALEEAGLTVALHLPETPVWVLADATRLTQVLDNLLENARKFTERDGEIRETYGHQVRVADTGPAGLEAAEAETPDVLLCDIGLPGMDGFAVAEAIRQNPRLATARLIALTGYGQEGDLQRSREAGFDEHLVKPVDPHQLLNRLQPR
jgi:PAS domain S-box-containing protein